jgi:hypothetical protein
VLLVLVEADLDIHRTSYSNLIVSYLINFYYYRIKWIFTVVACQRKLVKLINILMFYLTIIMNLNKEIMIIIKIKKQRIMTEIRDELENPLL